MNNTEFLKSLIEVIKCQNSFSDEDIELLQGIKRIVNSIEQEPKRWITIKGNHIPIFKGKSINQTIKEYFSQSSHNTSKFKKGKPMSFKEANEGKVNPNYKKGGGYLGNCQACIAVFEARLRGYNIETLPRLKNGWEELRKYPNIAFINPKTQQPPKIISTDTNTPTDCYKWLDKNLKKGERYAFGYQPKDSFTGHIITVGKNKDGKLFFYDAQKGKVLSPRILLNMEMYTVSIRGQAIKLPLLFRIDNTELNMEWLNKISKPY